MKKKLFLFIFLILIFPTFVNAEKSPYCDPNNEKYSEVGCEHIKSDWSDCAEFYDVCDVYSDNFDTDKCYEYKSAGLCTPYEFCKEVGILKTFRLVGYAFTIIKILIPLLLIIFGAIDMSKAVVAGDEKAIKNASSMLMTRAIAGVVIFFIPTIIDFAAGLISEWTNRKTEFENCHTCIFNVDECSTLITVLEK